MVFHDHDKSPTCHKLNSNRSVKMSFGVQLRKSYFLAGDGVLDISGSSRGVCPRVVVDAQNDFEMQQLVAPRDRKHLKRHWCDEARSVFAQELNCDPKDIVCAANVTDGLKMALRQLVHSGHSRIITLSKNYRDIFSQITDEQRKVPTGECKMYIDPGCKEFKAKFTAALKLQDRFHTCVVVPAEDVDYNWIIEQARENQVVTTVVVNNRGLGHEKIDICKMDPDMYVVEAGPYYFAGNSCSALYVSKKTQEKFYRPLPENSFAAARCGDLTWGLKLEDSALLEITPLVALCAAAKFRASVLGGSDVVIEYQNDLARRAVQYLVGAWKVKTCGTGATFSVESPFQPMKALASTFIEFVMSHLLREHKIVVSMAQLDEKVVFQFRAEVFLELGDFQALRLAVDEAFFLFTCGCRV